MLRSIAATLAAALVLTACSSEAKPKSDPPPPSNRDVPELAQVSPLTGLPMETQPTHPVFVVKIENTSSGEPQLALDDADVVFEELVEGGLTRLAAMYYSKIPGKVGHVRSLRATDIGIVAPVNGALVASGGAGGAVKRVKNADIKLFSEDAGAPGFSSDPALSRPYNRLIDLKRLAKEAKPNPPSAPLFPWTAEGETADPGTSKVSTATQAAVRFSRSTTTNWKLKGEHWVRTNGHAKDEFQADNLMVVFAKIGDAGYRDPAGNPVPQTEVEGTGRAVVLRGNQAIELTWNKPGTDAPFSFKTADGKPYTITPGRTFVELAPQGDGSVNLK